MPRQGCHDGGDQFGTVDRQTIAWRRFPAMGKGGGGVGAGPHAAQGNAAAERRAASTCSRVDSLAQSADTQAHTLAEWLRQIVNQVVLAQLTLRHVLNQIASAQPQRGTGFRIRGLRQQRTVSRSSGTTRPSGITPTTGIAIGTDITPTLITTGCLSLSAASGGD